MLLRFQSFIRLLMRQTGCYILLKLCVATDIKLLVIQVIVILQHLFQAVFFIQRTLSAFIVNRRIKQSRHTQFWILFPKLFIITHRFRNTAYRKNSMEFIISAQCQPILNDIVYNCILIRIRFIQLFRIIVLNALLVSTILLLHTGHRHFLFRHKMEVYFALFFIRNCLFHGGCICLPQSNFLS